MRCTETANSKNHHRCSNKTGDFAMPDSGERIMGHFCRTLRFKIRGIMMRPVWLGPASNTGNTKTPLHHFTTTDYTFNKVPSDKGGRGPVPVSPGMISNTGQSGVLSPAGRCPPRGTAVGNGARGTIGPIERKVREIHTTCGDREMVVWIRGMVVRGGGVGNIGGNWAAGLQKSGMVEALGDLGGAVPRD